MLFADFVTSAPRIFSAKGNTSFYRRRSLSDIFKLILSLWQSPQGRFFQPLDGATISYFKNQPQVCTAHFLKISCLDNKLLVVEPRDRRVLDQFLSVDVYFHKSIFSPIFHNAPPVFCIDYLIHYLSLLYSLLNSQRFFSNQKFLINRHITLPDGTTAKNTLCNKA